jgi:hypothetical protein
MAPTCDDMHLLLIKWAWFKNQRKPMQIRCYCYVWYFSWIGLEIRKPTEWILWFLSTNQIDMNFGSFNRIWFTLEKEKGWKIQSLRWAISSCVAHLGQRCSLAKTAKASRPKRPTPRTGLRLPPKACGPTACGERDLVEVTAYRGAAGAERALARWHRAAIGWWALGRKHSETDGWATQRHWMGRISGRRVNNGSVL